LTHDIVWVSDQRIPGGGIFEGKDATKRYLDGLGVSKHEALDVERVVDLGDRVSRDNHDPGEAAGLSEYAMRGMPQDWLR
jgi:hypothetical protein